MNAVDVSMNELCSDSFIGIASWKHVKIVIITTELFSPINLLCYY